MSDENTVYLPGEYCDVCGGTSRLGKWKPFGCEDDDGFTGCAWCFEDEPKFTAWFMRELKEFLEESPDYEELPNGNYKYIGIAGG